MVRHGAIVGPLASDTVVPAFADTTEILNESGTLYGENTASRTMLWTFAGDTGLASSLPVTDAGAVYVASAYSHLYALDATTGATLGTYALTAPVSEPLAVGDNVLVVPTSSDIEVFGGTTPPSTTTTSTSTTTTSTSTTTTTVGTGTGTPVAPFVPSPVPPSSGTTTTTATTVAITAVAATTTTHPRSAPTSAPVPQIDIVSSKAKVANGYLPVKLACRAATCSGAVQVSMATKHKTVVLAKATYKFLGAGHTDVLQLRVTAAGAARFATTSVKDACTATVKGGLSVTR